MKEILENFWDIKRGTNTVQFNQKFLPDPYVLEKDWEDDVKLLPDLEWPDVYHYLINTPSEFTIESLKAYKSLKAYNFFTNGHVQDVYYHSVEGNKEFCIIKTKVNKSE